MHRILLCILMFSISIVSQGQDLTQSIESAETLLAFRIPEDWTATFNPGGAATITLIRGDIELELYSPSTLIYDRVDHNVKVNELLSEMIQLYEWNERDFETETVNGRVLTVAEYVVDGFTGILVGIPLDDGQYATIDTIAWDRSVDRDLVLEIASTVELMSPPVTLENYDGSYRDVVAELEKEGVIPSGGQLVFQEDRAFFSGQGAFFTPLASNSPQANFVMAGTLDFTVGSDYRETEYPETCTLMGRLTMDGAGDVQEYIEVGLDNTGAFFYYAEDAAEEVNYGEFRRLDLKTTYHVLFVAQGKTLTLFLDGVQVASNLPIYEASGTFGVILRGYGPGAECVGEKIWVYQIPQLQTGVCRATTNANINKRVGPGTTFDIGGQLQANTSEDIIGRVVGDDGFVWWQLEDENWVRNDVVELLGDCREVPAVTGDI